VTSYIALLRAINVAGHRPVLMAGLLDFFASLGFADARSVLQSGNVVFRSKARETSQLERLLEVDAAKRFGLQTDFFVRTGEEWQAIVERNPFRKEAERDPSHLVVMCLKEAPGAARVAALRAAIAGREVVRASGRHLYVVYADGIGRSRLTNAVVENKLGTRGTGRNWNTVLKLDALVRAFLIALIALGGARHAAAQRAPSEASSKLCGDDNPDISIAGCTAIIESRREKGPALARAFAARGAAYMALQDFDRAIQDFTQAVTIDSADAGVFANRGAAYGARQEWDSAIRDFSRVVALRPNSAHAFSDRAAMYLLAGQPDKALQDFTDAIGLDPSFVDAILNRGLTLASTARCAQAIPDFTRVIELNATEARAFLERGVCYEKSARSDLALADFSAHLLLEPRSLAGFERRAAVEFHLGQYDRALSDYAQALGIMPNSARVLYGQGLVKRATGDLKGAEIDIATATALRPAIADEMAARGMKP
jgi:uncharacterized protein (DUF1697 family)/tetratricopeptide (TPR) repeat protein